MMRSIVPVFAACLLIAAAGNAQAPSAMPDSPPADAAKAGEDGELTRAQRRERRRAEEAAEAQAELAATTEAADGDEGADDEGLVCRRESVVGTHRRIRVCTTREQREATRMSAQELIRDVSRNRGVLGPEGQ